MWNLWWDFWNTAHSAESLWHIQSMVIQSMKLMSCLLWWGLESHGNWFVHMVVISVIMNHNLHLYRPLCFKPWTVFFHSFSWIDLKLRDSITHKISHFRPLTGLWVYHWANITCSFGMCAKINIKHISSPTSNQLFISLKLKGNGVSWITSLIYQTVHIKKVLNIHSCYHILI